MQGVYLCGGMRGGWQDKVKEACKGRPLFFLDPRDNDCKHLKECGPIDLHKIRRSDIIFAYLEATNPGGAALFGECGYGKGLGRTVIVINEKKNQPYWDFVSVFADVEFDDLEQAIEFLKKLGGQYG